MARKKETAAVKKTVRKASAKKTGDVSATTDPQPSSKVESGDCFNKAEAPAKRVLTEDEVNNLLLEQQMRFQHSLLADRREQVLASNGLSHEQVLLLTRSVNLRKELEDLRQREAKLQDEIRRNALYISAEVPCGDYTVSGRLFRVSPNGELRVTFLGKHDSNVQLAIRLDVNGHIVGTSGS